MFGFDGVNYLYNFSNDISPYFGSMEAPCDFICLTDKRNIIVGSLDIRSETNGYLRMCKVRYSGVYINNSSVTYGWNSNGSEKVLTQEEATPTNAQELT